MDKKYLLISLLSIAAVFIFTGCSNSPEKKNPSATQHKESAASSKNPEYPISSQYPNPDEDQTGNHLPKSYAAEEALKSTTPAEPVFQMGELLVLLGTSTVSELIEEGASLEPNGVISSLEFKENPGAEHNLTFSFRRSSFTVTAKNLASASSAIKNSVITAVYADQKGLSAIGGIQPGDSIGDLTYALGEPYLIIDGEAFSSTYAGLSAYCYCSRWDDKNILFFVDKQEETIVSFQESLPINYLYDASLLTDDQILQLIHDQEQLSGESALKAPRLADVPYSEYARSQLNDINYTSAKLFTLDDILEPETFNRDISSISEFVPDSILVVEYSAALTYPETEREPLALIDQKLDSSYQVYGCFYLLNPYFSDGGSIESNIGAIKIRNQDRVYTNREHLYEAIFAELSQDYGMGDYSVTEKSLDLSGAL